MFFLKSLFIFLIIKIVKPVKESGKSFLIQSIFITYYRSCHTNHYDYVNHFKKSF